MEEIKKVSDWEKEVGLLLRTDDPTLLNKEVTKEKFIALGDEHNFSGVNFQARTEWLEANGHEVSRKNLRNPELQPKLNS